MAQTMRLTSFGPVFVVPAQSIMYLVIKTYIYSRAFVSIEKKQRKKKKKLTYSPNNASGVVWACSRRHQPPCCVLVHCHVKMIHRLAFVARVGRCRVVVSLWLWLWLRREWECDVT